MFDTHCHLNFKRFKKNVDEVIQRASDAGVETIVVPGTDVKRSRKAVELAQQYGHLYAAVGIHPHHVYKYVSRVIPDSDPESRNTWILNQVQDDMKNIENLLQEEKVVAVGEIGMDRHVYENTKYEKYAVDTLFLELQKELLTRQVEFAKKHDLSIILHNREAKDGLLQILREVWDVKLEHKAVFHCCEPDEELLEFAKEHQMFIGVDGDVTYDEDKQEFIRRVPLDMLVIETDSPYILPEPLLSEKKYPNEPANVKYVAEAVAKLKSEKVKDVTQVTMENGERLFRLS